jgi:hypothetical protein
LRAAWIKPYRYARAPLNCRGELTIECPTTSNNWLDELKIQGKVSFEGYTGIAPNAWEDLEYLPRVRISSAGRIQLADLCKARLGIWTQQDFSGRKSFDQEFTNCKLHSNEKGDVITVEGHRHIDSVRIEKELPVEVSYKDGTKHIRHFKRFQGHIVPALTELLYPDRRATCEVEFKELTKGRLFPAKITMKDRFYPDWGPEIYTFGVAIVK